MIKPHASNPWRHALSAIRWRLGMNVVSEDLQAGSDEAISRFYSSRITQTGFLADPMHYERTRAEWIVGIVSGGTLLEVGCGDGGMTALLSPKVERLVALEVSAPSLEALKERELANVDAVLGMVETVSIEQQFTWIVMSEVLEHVRDPARVLRRCMDWLAPGANLLLTTPNGHWESNEHLHEFTLYSFTKLLIGSGAERITSGYLRDSENRRRWLTGQLTRAPSPPNPDSWHDRGIGAMLHRLGRRS